VRVALAHHRVAEPLGGQCRAVAVGEVVAEAKGDPRAVGVELPGFGGAGDDIQLLVEAGQPLVVEKGDVDRAALGLLRLQHGLEAVSPPEAHDLRRRFLRRGRQPAADTRDEQEHDERKHGNHATAHDDTLLTKHGSNAVLLCIVTRWWRIGPPPTDRSAEWLIGGIPNGK
jgi:hypothetical protein